MTSSELLHFWKCDATAWRVRNNISSSGFELANWESVVFRVFPGVFARLFVTQQRRRKARRLVHKVMKNGFEMLEKVRFFFSCTCQFSVNFACYYHLHFGMSLVKNFFWPSKNPLDIQQIFQRFHVNCGDGPLFWQTGRRIFLRSNRLEQNA